MFKLKLNKNKHETRCIGTKKLHLKTLEKVLKSNFLIILHLSVALLLWLCYDIIEGKYIQILIKI